jgi:AraC-like DNA-binding protein
MDMHTAPRGKSCFIFPLQTMAVIHVDRDEYTLLQEQNMIYLPPIPWKITVRSSVLSALVISVDTRTIQAQMTSSFGSKPYEEAIKQELERPLLLSRQTEFGTSFIDSVQASLRFIESILMQANSAMPRLEVGELLLRQLIFLWNDQLQGKMQEGSCTLDLNQLVDWIRQHCCEPICLADLEALSGYTSRNLQRAFRKRFGCGPMQYLRRERLNIACHKLETSPPGTRIMAIADACGYKSLSAFSRDFKDAYKVTPKNKLGCLWHSVREGEGKVSGGQSS